MVKTPMMSGDISRGRPIIDRRQFHSGMNGKDTRIPSADQTVSVSYKNGSHQLSSFLLLLRGNTLSAVVLGFRHMRQMPESLVTTIGSHGSLISPDGLPLPQGLFCLGTTAVPPLTAALRWFLHRFPPLLAFLSILSTQNSNQSPFSVVENSQFVEYVPLQVPIFSFHENQMPTPDKGSAKGWGILWPVLIRIP